MPSELPTLPVEPPRTTQDFKPVRKRFQPAANPTLPALDVDAEGSIVKLTGAARRLLEYRDDEAIEPCFFSHVHGKNLYQIMRDVADMVCYGKASATWLLRLRSGRGRWRWFRVDVFNRLDDDDVNAIRLVLHDLHEW